MINHVGPSPNCGHYTSIAEAPNGNFYKWLDFHHNTLDLRLALLRFDDASVSPTSLQNALNTSAYVIFYEMVKTSRNQVPSLSLVSTTRPCWGKSRSCSISTISHRSASPCLLSQTTHSSSTTTAPPCRTISPGASTSPFPLTTCCSSTSPRSLWWRSTVSRPRSRSSPAATCASSPGTPWWPVGSRTKWSSTEELENIFRCVRQAAWEDTPCYIKKCSVFLCFCLEIIINQIGLVLVSPLSPRNVISFILLKNIKYKILSPPHFLGL